MCPIIATNDKDKQDLEQGTAILSIDPLPVDEAELREVLSDMGGSELYEQAPSSSELESWDYSEI